MSYIVTQMESVRQEVLRRDLMLQEKDRQILELHETIAKERSRVIGVSSLTEPIQVRHYFDFYVVS